MYIYDQNWSGWVLSDVTAQTATQACCECMWLESTGAAPAVGFNGVAAVARQSLTALSMAVGTGDDSVADVGTAFNQTTLNNNFRDPVNKVNAIRTILVNVGIAV